VLTCLPQPRPPLLFHLSPSTFSRASSPSRSSEPGGLP
jgi:hypothetical protein